MQATEHQNYSMIGHDTGIDWSGCDAVEVIPGKVSGVPILKHTRVPADFIVINRESGSSIDEILENFVVDRRQVREVLQHAAGYRREHRRAA